ncbi:uncharacterized protein V6R79_001323 [Siganus canaliculatus]
MVTPTIGGFHPINLHPNPHGPKLPPKQDKGQFEEEDIRTEEEKEHDVHSRHSISRVLPQPLRLKWTSMEMDEIPLDTKLTHRQGYNIYLTSCQNLQLHMRTFVAFQKKRKQLLKDA